MHPPARGDAGSSVLCTTCSNLRNINKNPWTYETHSSPLFAAQKNISSICPFVNARVVMIRARQHRRRGSALDQEACRQLPERGQLAFARRRAETGALAARTCRARNSPALTFPAEIRVASPVPDDGSVCRARLPGPRGPCRGPRTLARPAGALPRGPPGLAGGRPAFVRGPSAFIGRFCEGFSGCEGSTTFQRRKSYITGKIYMKTCDR